MSGRYARRAALPRATSTIPSEEEGRGLGRGKWGGRAKERERVSKGVRGRQISFRLCSMKFVFHDSTNSLSHCDSH
jgi:hypothetical protein